MEDNKNLGEIVIFNSEDGDVRVQIDAVNETIWLTQKNMAQLFDVSISTISRHISNIVFEGELEEKSILRFLQIANSDKPVAFYNLDMVIAVGYRVNSKRATQFHGAS